MPLVEEAGLTLARLAVVLTLEHPAVTSAIIGPRTPDHLETLLGVDEVRSDADVLDRIDELPPATNVAPEGVWELPGSARCRRRRLA